MKSFIKYATVIGAFVLIAIMMVLPNDTDRAEAQFYYVVDSIESTQGLHAAIIYCQDKQAESDIESHQYRWSSLMLSSLENKIDPNHIGRINYLVEKGDIQSAIRYCKSELKNSDINNNTYTYFESKIKELNKLSK